MAAKKMTVRDAYAKAKKQGQGKPAPKGALQQRGVKGEARPQNPSARNKVGVKSKNKPGPWDDILRGVVKGAKIGGAVAKEVTKPARDPIGAAVDTIKGIRKDVKDKNIKGLAFQAMTAVPMGRGGKAISKALKAGETAVDAAQGAATVAGNVAKGAKKATKAAKKTSKAVKKTTKAADSAPKVSEALQKANQELADINKAMSAFKGPKASGGKMSSGWAELNRKRDAAQKKVNSVLQREQQAGKAAENVKKTGSAKVTSRDTSLGSTTVGKKGDGGVPLPENTKAYSRIPKNTKDTANPPLEKNQRYAYEADPMKKAEGGDRFWQREQRRMDKSAKNKERQAKVDAKEKQARVNAKWKEIKEKSKKGGPKAQERLNRYRDYWNGQGYNLK